LTIEEAGSEGVGEKPSNAPRASSLRASSPCASSPCASSPCASSPCASSPCANGLALAAIALFAAGLVLHRLHFDRPQHHGFESFDLEHYFEPAFAFFRQALQRGELPFWNPHQLAGQPFLALHASGPLYPIHIALLSFWDAARALELQFVIHLCGSGWFTWLFARRVGLDTAGATAASATFMMSGPALYWLYLPPYAATEAWLPAVMWALHRLLTRPSPAAACALAAFLAMSFHGGYAQGFLYLVQLGGLYGVFGLIVLTRPGERLRALGWAAVAGITALGLVAPQAIASVEQASDSVRGLSGLPIELAVDEGSFTPERLLRGWVGLPKAEDAVATGPLAWFVTLPLLALPLIALGWRGRAFRAHWLAGLVLFAGTGLFMLGTETPVFRVYFGLPFGDVFRGPIRVAPLYMWSAALLVGMGVAVLTSGAGFGSRSRIVGLALVAILMLDGYRHTRLVSTHPILADRERGPSALVEMMRERSDGKRLFVAQPEVLHAPPELISKFGTLHGLFAVPDYEPNMPADYRRYFDETSDPPWRGHIGVLEYARRRPAQELVRLLDLMSVGTYAFVGEPAPLYMRALRDFTGAAGTSGGQLHWFDRELALPRAYAVHRSRSVGDLAVALATIVQPAFRPFHEVIVVGEHEPLTGPAVEGNRDRVQIVEIETEHVSIEADCATECIVVLTDLYYPGWRVSVDGAPAQLLRVNGIFRGVQVEAGVHRIAHEFRPTAVRIGLPIALASLGGWLALAALALRERSRGRVL
jgi:hypothetical protein